MTIPPGTRRPVGYAARIAGYLTRRSGSQRGEAWAMVALRVVTLALAVVCVVVVVTAVQEWGWRGLVVAPFALVGMLLALGITFLAGNELVRDRLRPGRGYHRLRERDVAALQADGGPGPTVDDVAATPEGALVSSPRGQATLLTRTGVSLVLGLPAAAFVVFCLLAYVHQAWVGWSDPSVDAWAWDAPRQFLGLGRWFFTDESLVVPVRQGEVTVQALVVLLSAVPLGAGIILALHAAPALLRRGADAIDLGVPQTGAVTRGGLALGWDEISAVLVVHDQRVTADVERRGRTAGGLLPPFVLRPTFVRGHSRTRVALVLRDVRDVAARATVPQRRGLLVDDGVTHGYALCDLWVYPTDRVTEALAALAAGARRARVPVSIVDREIAES